MWPLSNQLRSFLMTIAISAPLVVRAQSSGCYASSSDAPALALLSFARYSVGATDSVSAAGRPTAGIPVVDSSNVMIVNNSRTCASVVDAINVYERTPGRARLVHIAQLDKSGFMAYDGVSPPAAVPAVRVVYNISKTFVVRSILLGL